MTCARKVKIREPKTKAYKVNIGMVLRQLHVSSIELVWNVFVSVRND